MRLLVLCLLASVVTAEAAGRLGTLIRWYLKEQSPARREDYLEAIERLTENDPRPVADAIRAGLHFEHRKRPVLRTGGRVPSFGLDSPRVQPVAECAGDFATLYLPERYDPGRAYPLLLELGKSDIPLPEETILVRIQTSRHPQTRVRGAFWAAEALVLSLLTHLVDVVHVDPRRVFLRADKSKASLAWYIALHNPDRFAGVLGARGVWAPGAKLAPNGQWFVGLAIERYQGDRQTLAFMNALKKYNPHHLHRRAGPTARQNHEFLMPTIRKWWSETRRPQRPTEIELVCDRGTALRAFWIRMAPRAPSRRKTELGHWVTARNATLKATADGNLVTVEAYRVNAFDIFVEPKMFDPNQPVRVAVNGQVPESKLIHMEIGDLLEDYRERRDTDLLYCCRLRFAVRGR